MKLGNILGLLIMGLIGILMVTEFVPLIDAAVVAGNITGITGSMLGIVSWVLPVAVVAGLIFGAVKLFRGRG